MAILKLYTNDLSGKQTQFRDQGDARINSLFQNIKSQFEMRMKSQWTDESANGGLTIQQKFDAYGTDAAQLFSIAAATGTMLVTMEPSYVPPTPATYGYTYVIHQDGTVTVSQG